MAQRFPMQAGALVLSLTVCAGWAVPPGRAADEGGEKIYERTVRATVWILAPRGKRTATGSGSLIDEKRKLVITSYHVVGESEQVRVAFAEFNRDKKLIAERNHYLELGVNRFIPAKVLHRDTTRDLAVLELQDLPRGVHVLRLASQSAGPGNSVHSIGNPGRSDALWEYTSGTVRQRYHKKWQAKDGNAVHQFEADVLETQSPTNAGDSGGPLVNKNGELVGITQGMALDAQLLSFFIDVGEVRAFLKEHKLLAKLPVSVAQGGSRNQPRTETNRPPEPPAAGDKAEKAASAKLQLAKDLAAEGKVDRARGRYEQIINDYPNTKAAAEARTLLDKLNK
jgi:S1-C subfamily serine protease